MREIAKAIRAWRRTPRLALAIMACIAVSIGGASTVLTFVYSLLLRPLPYPEASRLVFVEPEGGAPRPGDRPYLSYPDFFDLRESATSFEKVEGAMVSRLIVVTSNGAERLRGESVSPGYFELFGLRPQRGRLFTRDEYLGQGERAMLISSRLWRAHFGGREELIGEAVETRAGPAVVVGVMPEGYLGVAEDEGTDYWLAERQTNHPALLAARGEPTVLVFGRLGRGVSMEAARHEVASIVAGLARSHPDTSRTLKATIEPLPEKWRADLRPGLLIMLVASIFLLAIGCANVAILLLARLVSRERDLAIRLSMGANRRDLLRLMGVEGMIVAATGGGAGVLLSLWLSGLFESVAGMALPSHLPVAFGLGPLFLSFLAVTITGIAFTLLPALIATRIRSADALRSGSRSVAAGALQGRSGRLLVVGQTALAVALLAGAVMFLRSYERLRFVDMGFRTEGLLRYQVSLQSDRYGSPEAVEAFYRQLSTDLSALPGVRGLAYLGPTLPPYDVDLIPLRVKGQDLPTPDGSVRVNRHFATNDALSILRVPLLQGRLFGPADPRGGRAAALVSKSLARLIAPSGSPIGRTLSLPGGVEAVVVGVVRDARWNGQRDRHPSGLNLFLSLDQFPQSSVGVLFDCAVDPRSLIDPVRRAVVRRDPTAALHWIDTMEEALDFQTVSERFWAFLAAAYALTAFSLAGLGLYGLLTHNVASRTREIGIRMALGATSGAVARLVAGQGLRLVASGLVFGIALSFLAGRLIESRLYETSTADPRAYAVVAALLLITGALIAWAPARRASRLSPTTALRSE